MKHFLIAASLLLGGCASTQVAEVRPLQIKVDPAVIQYGVAATVEVTPPKAASLKWVKGTVAFPGFKKVPEVSLKYDKATRTWKRKLPPVPAIIPIKPGFYTVKVWGKGKAGGRYEGTSRIEFK